MGGCGVHVPELVPNDHVPAAGLAVLQLPAEAEPAFHVPLFRGLTAHTWIVSVPAAAKLRPAVPVRAPDGIPAKEPDRVKVTADEPTKAPLAEMVPDAAKLSGDVPVMGARPVRSAVGANVRADAPISAPLPVIAPDGLKTSEEAPVSGPLPVNMAVGVKVSVEAPAKAPLPVRAAVGAKTTELAPDRAPRPVNVAEGLNVRADEPESAPLPIKVEVGEKTTELEPDRAPMPVTVPLGEKVSDDVPVMALGAEAERSRSRRLIYASLVFKPDDRRIDDASGA